MHHSAALYPVTMHVRIKLQRSGCEYFKRLQLQLVVLVKLHYSAPALCWSWRYDEVGTVDSTEREETCLLVTPNLSYFHDFRLAAC